jgi:hypothetical protein
MRGLVRDTIARQSDVDKSSMKYEVEPGTGKYRNGTITFSAQKGKSLDLEKIHSSLRATRLGGGTNSGVNFLEITARGEVAVVEKETLLKVSDTTQQFTLGDDPKAKPKEGTKTPFQRLREALAKGEKVTSVTGRVHGWSGRWPEVLRALSEDSAKSDQPTARKPTQLIVTDFQTAPK